MGLVPQLDKAARANAPTVANVSGDNREGTLNPINQVNAYEAIVSRLSRVPVLDDQGRVTEESWHHLAK